jgi:hypothetical protein
LPGHYALNENLIHRKAKQENFSGSLFRKLIETVQRLKKLVPPKNAGHIYGKQTANPKNTREQSFPNQVTIEEVLKRAEQKPRKSVEKERSAVACID